MHAICASPVAGHPSTLTAVTTVERLSPLYGVCRRKSLSAESERPCHHSDAFGSVVLCPWQMKMDTTVRQDALDIT